MAEKVNIASLTINVDDVIKESAKLKKNIDDLKKSQKELDTTTEEGSQAYAKNEAQLKNLSKAYRDNQNFAAALEATNEDLNKTLETQGKSTQELYDSRRQLQQLAKNIQGSSEEEIALRNQLNEAIDQQTEAIREQSSSYIKGKDSIGEYTQGINASDLSIQGLIKNSQQAGGATNLFTQGIKGAVKGLLSFTKASLAFLLTPIGAVLAVIAGAFVLIQNAMNRSEESTNKIRKAFSAFTGIIQGVLKYLEPLGEFLIDGIVGALELVEKAVFAAMSGLAAALDFLGFEETAASLKEFTGEIKESAEASKALTLAEIELEKSQRKAQKTQLDYQKRAEKLRQVRDDENKSIAERIKANEELGEVLKEQLAEELKIAEQALKVAELRIVAEGETSEALDEQAEALTRISDIQERITGQESEQLKERVALQKEASQRYIAQKQAELDIFLKSQELIDKSVQEQLSLEQEAANRRIKILEAERRSGLKTRQEYANELKNIQLDLALKEKELAEEAAQIKIDESKRAAEAATEIAKAELDRKLKEEEEAKEREEQEKEKKAIDFQNELAILEEQNLQEREVLFRKLEADRLAEVEEAEKTGADIELINKKFANREKQIEEELSKNKLAISKGTFEGIAELLGESTAAGKAAGVAVATINTYQGVTEVWKAPSVLPEPFNTASKLAATATTLASGFKAVRNIASTNTQFAKGDILKGKSHALGGIPFSIGGMLGFEAEGGEALINKKSTAMYKPLLSAINFAGGGKKFQSGGIAGATTSTPTAGLIDYDLLNSTLSESIRNLPPSIVSVEEISTVATNVEAVENLATD